MATHFQPLEGGGEGLQIVSFGIHKRKHENVKIQKITEKLGANFWKNVGNLRNDWQKLAEISKWYEKYSKPRRAKYEGMVQITLSK